MRPTADANQTSPQEHATGDRMAALAALKIMREVRSELVKDSKFELSRVLNSAILILKPTLES